MDNGNYLIELISANPLVETLTDYFNQVTLNTGLWTEFLAGSATTTYASTGAQVNFPTATTSSTDGDITSNVVYDLTNSYAYLHVISVPSATTSADAWLMLKTTTSNYIRWVYEGGTLFAQYDVAGSKTTAFSVTYNSSTHAWWRIREGTGGGGGGSAGNVYWDTSVDGITWTQRATVATPITVTDLSVQIAGIGTTIDVSPGTFKWNNFNLQNPITSNITFITYRPAWLS